MSEKEAPYGRITITVLTAKEKPVIEISLNPGGVWAGDDVDKLVKERFGKQPNKAPHNWKGG